VTGRAVGGPLGGGNNRKKKKVGLLYLVIPVTGGKVMGVAKFGFGRAPVDCKDFVTFVKKHSQRYGTSFKDDIIDLYAN
jgi:hypothetical protein